MKRIIFASLISLSMVNAIAQRISDSTVASSLSPLVSAALLLDSVTLSTASPFASTQAGLQGRGVAGREQLKDELVALNEDMLNGTVKDIAEVRQSGLRELFSEISADPEKMREIETTITEGDTLYKVATAVAVTLLAQ